MVRFMTKKLIVIGIFLIAFLVVALLWFGDYLGSGSSVYKAGRASSFPGYFDKVLGVLDLNGDGLNDFVIGGKSTGTQSKTPIRFITSNSDGTLTDSTTSFLNDPVAAFNPVGVVADFNGDGILDIAIFDGGPIKDQHDSSDYGGGYEGSVPHMLFSQADGTWSRSNILENAAEDANKICSPSCNAGNTLHVKSASVGDVNSDGRPDIFVESGGGYRQIQGHFLLSTENGGFSVALLEDAIRVGIFPGGAWRWRWASSLIADIDGDGYNDLILGRLAKPNNFQDDMRNSVVFNSGRGNFINKNRVELAQPDWNDNWTYVKAIAAADINQDGLLDIALAHQRSNNGLPSDNSGRYIQILINQGGRRFTDETMLRIGVQKTETAVENALGYNYSTPDQFLFLDVDADGDLDLVAAYFPTSVRSGIPYLYLNDGEGNFSPEDPNAARTGKNYYSIPFVADINGDGKADLVMPDIDNGPDGKFTTEDDITKFRSYIRR